ncbi:MAG: RNA polymerase sigma-70 factor [Bacteroidales bacterium]|nr:RNA polymerase sigma-70 factor [Bacteroidales bacterium]
MLSDYNQYWQKIRLGDEEALEALYKQSFPHLISYARTITGQLHLAEEIVQDVLLKIWQNRSVIIIQGSFKSYLVKAVHNQALNALRGQKTNKEQINQPSKDELWQFIDENYDHEEPFINHLFADETLNIIKNIVEELPEKRGRIFRMSRFEGLSNREISKILHISENTVKTHIYIALKKISEVLDKKS